MENSFKRGSTIHGSGFQQRNRTKRLFNACVFDAAQNVAPSGPRTMNSALRWRDVMRTFVFLAASFLIRVSVFIGGHH